MTEQILNLLTEQGKAFEAMKEANDRRLEALEKNHAVGELTETVAKIQNELINNRKQIEALEKEAAAKNSLQFSTNKTGPQELREELMDIYKGGFFQNAVRTDDEGDGGYAVPEGLDKKIDDYIMADVKLLQLCTVAPFIANYKKDVTIIPATVTDGTEGVAATETTTPKLEQVTAVEGKLLAKAKVTEESRRDLMFSPEEWVKDNISMIMAETLEQRLLSGTGADGETLGILKQPYNFCADATRSFKTIQCIKTGANGNFVAFDSDTGVGPLDCLKDARGSLKSAYRRGAVWLMNTVTESLIQKLKDSEGNYLWRPGLVAGEPNTLFGYPVHISDFMPDPATNSLSILFGDFKRAVRVGYGNSTYVVRDNITVFPDIFLMFSKFYDLTLRDSRALKMIKFAQKND